jgi:hypothetical protein
VVIVGVVHSGLDRVGLERGTPDLIFGPDFGIVQTPSTRRWRWTLLVTSLASRLVLVTVMRSSVASFP